MLIKTLLKKCETGFDLVIIVDSTSGHTMEYSSVKDAQIEAGSNKVIAWEIGVGMSNTSHMFKFVLYITI